MVLNPTLLRKKIKLSKLYRNLILLIFFLKLVLSRLLIIEFKSLYKFVLTDLSQPYKIVIMVV